MRRREGEGREEGGEGEERVMVLTGCVVAQGVTFACKDGQASYEADKMKILEEIGSDSGRHVP